MSFDTANSGAVRRSAIWMGSRHEISVEPGYVRMRLNADAGSAGNIAATREFARLCQNESTRRAVLVNGIEGEPARLRLREALGVLAHRAPAQLRLAVVARGAAQAASERVLEQHGGLDARVFRSEAEAAAWLLS